MGVAEAPPTELAPVLPELPQIMLFGKWSCEDVSVSDMSLQDYIAVKEKYARYMPHSAPEPGRRLSGTSSPSPSVSPTSSSTLPRDLPTATQSRRRMSWSVWPSPTDKHRSTGLPILTAE